MAKFSFSTLFFLWSLMLLQAVICYFKGFLFQEQISAQGYGRGLPFLGHSQMWTDIVLITPAAAFIVQQYSKQWGWRAIYVFAVIAFCVSAVIHIQYTKTDVPGCHVLGGTLSEAGWVHFVFMTVCLTILGLFFLNTKAQWAEISIIAALLFAHLLIGFFQIPLYLGTSILDWANRWQLIIGLACLSLGMIKALISSPK